MTTLIVPPSEMPAGHQWIAAVRPDGSEYIFATSAAAAATASRALVAQLAHSVQHGSEGSAGLR